MSFLIDIRNNADLIKQQLYPADPKGFFAYRIDKEIAESEGVERFAFQLLKGIGFASFALAIDPLYQFRFSPVKVWPSNRTRRRSIVKGTARTEIRTGKSLAFATPIKSETPYAYDLRPIEIVQSSTTQSSVARAAQPLLLSFVSDTTRRTRPIGVDEGEFEKLTGKLHSRGDGWSLMTYKNDTRLTYPWDSTRIILDTEVTSRRMTNYRARFTSSSWDSVRDTERSRATAVIQQNRMKLLRQLMPTSRLLGLARSVAELRELPQTVLTSFEGILATVGKGSLKEQPINFLFGIKPLLDDIKRLVGLPEKLAKMVNYRLKRNGQPTTFRTKFDWIEPIANPPGFTYELMSGETSMQTETEGNRKITLRAMANVNVKFPLLQIPLYHNLSKSQMRNILSYDLTGTIPRLVDIYNLIPWTWLIDWYAGLADYIDVVDMINGDQNLINFGMITYISEGFIKTSYSCNRQFIERLTIDGSTIVNQTNLIPLRHESHLRYEYRKRVSFGTDLGVRQTSIDSSLTSYQLAIIGALALAKS